jgi:hypothetical protein
MAQRHLSVAEVEYIRLHGECFHQAGAVIYYLRKRDIPAWDQVDDRWARLAGTAVILTKDNRRLITVWRNLQHGLKKIKHKSKYSLTEEQLGWAF